MTENQTDLSFEQLIEMSNFSLDDVKPAQEPKVEITLTQEEEEAPKDETKVEEQKPAEVKTEITLEQQPTIYKELVKEKLTRGELDDVIIVIDGEEKQLSELDNLDEETYNQVVEEYNKTKDEDFKSKYVSVEDLNETQKALINIVKSGDLEKAKELFEKPQLLQEPFQGYDSSSDEHNEQVLAWYYGTLGHSKKEIEALVSASKEDLTLDLKAEKIVEFQKTQFKDRIRQEEVSAQEAKKQEEDRIKSYRKDLMSTLKEEGLSETMSRKFVDVATKYDKDGNLEIDTIYDEWMSDPKKAKELIYFMLDKESYLNKAKSAVKTEVQKDLLKKVNIVRDTTKTSKVKEEEQSPSNPFETLVFKPQE